MLDTGHVLPFAVRLRPGLPVDEQVLRAFEKALAAGQLASGDRFPSVARLVAAAKTRAPDLEDVLDYVRGRRGRSRGRRP